MTGNPTYVRPSVLIMYREDHEFLLDSGDPDDPARARGDYDFVLASQPWRARMSAEFKAAEDPRAARAQPRARRATAHDPVLRPRSRARGRAAPVAGREPVPGRPPRSPARRSGRRSGPRRESFDLTDPSDDEALFQFQMHTLPSEIGDRIGTSTLFAAWNAVIYVNQIEDERLDSVVTRAPTSRRRRTSCRSTAVCGSTTRRSSSRAVETG